MSGHLPCHVCGYEYATYLFRLLPYCRECMECEDDFAPIHLRRRLRRYMRRGETDRARTVNAVLEFIYRNPPYHSP